MIYHGDIFDEISFYEANLQDDGETNFHGKATISLAPIFESERFFNNRAYQGPNGDEICAISDVSLEETFFAFPTGAIQQDVHENDANAFRTVANCPAW